LQPKGSYGRSFARSLIACDGLPARRERFFTIQSQTAHAPPRCKKSKKTMKRGIEAERLETATRTRPVVPTSPVLAVSVVVPPPGGT